MKNIYEFLQERGYIYQQTDEKAIKEKLSGKDKITFYLGVDPTANSLHIGHFFALMIFRYLQEAGHKGILIIGGATAQIPDPTGKKDLRKMLTKEEINDNIKEVKTLCERFIITEGENAAIIVNNADWIADKSYIDFMREIGIHFNVNTMLTTEAYKKRLEEGGLTFLEMGYMLMQAYDFVHLNKEYNCTLQIGGSDQWANIVAGYDLARKMDQTELIGMTCPLLVNSEGEKMGKTAKGALWVAKEKTSVYDFYQYWINIPDKDVETMLRLLTKIDLNEVKQMCKDNIVNAKKIMAFEVTKLIHGKEEALIAKKTSEELFEKGSIASDMPTFTLDKQVLIDNINILDLLVLTKLLPSKSEARRLIEQGGILLNNNRIIDTNMIITLRDTIDNCIIIQKGKKTFLKIEIE
jgi:tyrosyl-tRNA synthetase